MTKTILRIDASARYTDSVSRALGDDFIAARPDAKVITRDLAKATPQVTEEWVGATFTPPEARTEAQRKVLEFSDELVAELAAADEILLTTPLYNFSAPASFKAWVDLIARAGVTFKYTETGPIGLLDNKPVTIIVSSGGVALGSPVDFFSAHARQVFSFVGITDVTFVGAQGGSEDAIAGAKAELVKLAA
jgi:FMN-dependent NADH-azoreductase